MQQFQGRAIALFFITTTDQSQEDQQIKILRCEGSAFQKGMDLLLVSLTADSDDHLAKDKYRKNQGRVQIKSDPTAAGSGILRKIFDYNSTHLCIIL